MKALSVRQLNVYVKSLLEGDLRLTNITVAGEISNLKNHYSSGHLYFTLKDKDASIRCVMFRSAAERIKFVPKDGMQILLRGRVSIYEKDGQYQLYAEEMSPVGLGDISLNFEKIKAKLEAEGLFNPENKRKIPKYPARIAVVTSETGAAVRDVINILSRRWPLCRIIMCPVSVQGQSAVPEMLSTLDRLYAAGAADLIIIGRGGGSIEDLWAFNSEELARKIYESPVPVISAVGHETDFTICDFVADLRAPTPSAAAELAVPDRNDIKNRLDRYNSLMTSALSGKYKYSKARLDALTSSAFFRRPSEALVFTRTQTLDRDTEKLTNIFKSVFSEKRNLALTAIAKLDSLSPLKVIARGYSVAVKDETVLTSAAKVTVGDNVTVRLTDGSLDCKVENIRPLNKKEKFN